MFPIFTADGLLPPGDVALTLDELRASVLVDGPGTTCPNWDAEWRLQLVDNLEIMVRQLWRVGITDVFADGSFVEDKATRTISTVTSSVTCMSWHPGAWSAN